MSFAVALTLQKRSSLFVALDACVLRVAFNAIGPELERSG